MQVSCIHVPAKQWFVIFCKEGDGLPLMSSSPSPTCGKQEKATDEQMGEKRRGMCEHKD